MKMYQGREYIGNVTPNHKHKITSKTVNSAIISTVMTCNVFAAICYNRLVLQCLNQVHNCKSFLVSTLAGLNARFETIF